MGDVAAISAVRWAAKKTARCGLALASGGAAGVTGRSGRRRRQMRVLTYHRFDATRRDPFAVTPAQFRRQMAYLAASGAAANLAQVMAAARGDAAGTAGGALVTIDDGVASVYREALPVLREYRIPAVMFITPSLIGAGRGGRAKAADWPEPFMTWDEVGRLAEAGLSIGSHAWTHRSLGGRLTAEVEDEACRSRAELERRLGRPVSAFAYPFGTRADFNAEIAAVLKRCGYTVAFTSQHGPVVAGQDPLQLPRVKVEGGEGLWLFRLLLDGGLDAWRWVDRGLWRLQARRG